MGETAAVLGVRQWSDRQSVLGHDDELLVAGVRAGDRDAFEEIYDRYARGILAFCVHMLGNREAAEDALQLTFVAAYRALQRGDSSIALRPWLYTIARNRCLSELRARREAAGVDHSSLTDASLNDGLADQVQRREDLREMLDDMQRLPADQRAALVLFELGDHPQKEIATVLGVRTEKVKALVFQAREALVRGRAAREHPCRDIREQLATLEGRIPARSVLRAHIERCPGCQSFEHDVRHQRAALALILPVALTGELKSWILGSAVHSGGAVVAGVGACGGGSVAAGACGGGAVVSGATVVSGVGGAGAVSAATAGAIAGTGAGTAAIATSAPVVAAAAGLTAVGESVGGLSATGVMAKILTAAAIATVAASSGHNDKLLLPDAGAATAKAHHRRLASAIPLKATHRPPRAGGAATVVPPSVTATPVGSPTEPPSSTPATSAGATSTATSSPSATTGAGAMTPPTAGGAADNDATSAPSTPGNGSTSSGTSTTASAPADSGSGTTTPPSSGASSTNDGAGSSAAASTNPTSSPAPDQTTATTTNTSTPPATATGSTDGSASAPATAATNGTSVSTDTTSAAGVTAPAASPATSTAAAPLSATAAASGGDAAATPTATATAAASSAATPGS